MDSRARERHASHRTTEHSRAYTSHKRIHRINSIHCTIEFDSSLTNTCRTAQTRLSFLSIVLVTGKLVLFIHGEHVYCLFWKAKTIRRKFNENYFFLIKQKWVCIRVDGMQPNWMIEVESLTLFIQIFFASFAYNLFTFSLLSLRSALLYSLQNRCFDSYDDVCCVWTRTLHSWHNHM